MADLLTNRVTVFLLVLLSTSLQLTLLSVFPIPSFTPHQNSVLGTCISPVLQMWALKPREGEYLAQSLRLSKWQNRPGMQVSDLACPPLPLLCMPLIYPRAGAFSLCLVPEQNCIVLTGRPGSQRLSSLRTKAIPC